VTHLNRKRLLATAVVVLAATLAALYSWTSWSVP
jgi:hypothetical protein